MTLNVTDPHIPQVVSALSDKISLIKQQKLSLLEVLQLADDLSAAGQKAAAAEVYKNWVAFNPDNPLIHVAYFNYGVALNHAGDAAGAIQALRACVKFEPGFGPAHINLGRVLEDSGQLVQAVQQWQAYAAETADVVPDRVSHRQMALQNIGRVLESADQMDDAEKSLLAAFELQPSHLENGQHWASLRQRQCKWPVLAPSGHVTERQMLDAMSSLTLSCYSDDPLFQLAKAYKYNRALFGSRPALDRGARGVVRPRLASGQRIRVGYLSSDLRDHAVGFALVEVLELHDKSKVEVYAYYCGERRINDATQTRIKAATDCWRDIAAMTDAEAAAQISADEVDILIDVNGYTKHARPKIFSYRPAPVIVNFCGYPGSMGSPFHQYLIADPVIIPPGSEIYYSEKVLRIPCNQPLDRKRLIADMPSRKDVGLPEDKFVFASFNGMQKITPQVFMRWLAILALSPNSVLWLLTGGEGVDQRLRDMAKEANIGPERLIFAAKAANPKHLARIALADLFLDTFPYGAHSTAADSITRGLPVLTMPGKSFAARFCASVVTAAGAPELLCASPEDYIRKAVEFARAPQTLLAIRESLKRQREACVLRDMPATTRQLEALLHEMQEDAEEGRVPVPDLSNLDIYYEIGAELAQTPVEFETEEAYRARYRERLAEWHDYMPLPADNKLWPASGSDPA
ncbi:tetratricopeptide repeat protein [Rhizobium sp. SSA_523]|uniref:O-linked N-acetylglucosamine transferase, SPINDLY family protein n=1 Tax=Rhizobium sp. SSA_523 TaxID=2952477 RepID=UPI002091A7C2|nr:tetratricopeptide repeat protein [Rhizobium sp. SSA_523]MCO5733023.1 tetratricopeptide repeat protein [Rhizobium sp. SSA_523]WKC23903.1 tetratricopeptide repeat protein [Rhizobium sp. SSA_523]